MGTVLLSNTKNVRGSDYWGGVESENHDNMYSLLTQGSVSTCGVIMGSVYHIKFNMGYDIGCQRTINPWFNWIGCSMYEV